MRPFESLYTYHKKNFWILQVTGWFIFSSYSFLVTTTTVFTRTSGVLPAIGIFIWLATGFLLTLLMRIVYKSEFFRQQILVFRLVIVIFLPITLSLLWILEFNSISPLFVMKSRYSIFDSFKNFILDFVFVHGPFYLWTFFYFGIKSWYSFIDQKITAEKAVSMLNYANLQMLRYQLNPHFLFNSLNSIKALIHENQELAERTVTSLSEFLRATLQYNERLMIQVSEEISIIEKYLSIEKIRYEERLDFSLISDEDVKAVEIPCLITQPLVENSIKHGLYKTPQGIKIIVRFYKKGAKIIVEVSNSGHLEPDWKKGVGLKNLEERLHNCYPGKVSFTIDEKDNTVFARIIIDTEIWRNSQLLL